MLAHPLTAAEAAHAASFSWDPWGLAVIAAASGGYALGLRALRAAGVRPAAVRGWQIACYVGGVIALVVALVSPLDSLSDLRFAAHMSQHELLMVVAAPLMVLGRPFFVYLWALPVTWRRRAASALASPSLKVARAFFGAPLLVLTLHALIRWIWHIPALFEGAMEHDALHAFQHFTFFASAAWLWWTVLHGRFGRAGYGVGLLFVFVTAFHTSLLAALLTTAPEGFYPIYAERGLDAGAELLEDQELGGLLMWVPSAVVLLVSALALFIAWLGEAERRARRADALRARRLGATKALTAGQLTEETA
jgi:putative membrane protein